MNVKHHMVSYIYFYQSNLFFKSILFSSDDFPKPKARLEVVKIWAIPEAG